MSTDYSLVCDAHKHFVSCASNTMGSAGTAGHERSMAAFVISHKACTLRVIDEHELCDLLHPKSYSERDESWKQWETTSIEYFLDDPEVDITVYDGDICAPWAALDVSYVCRHCRAIFDGARTPDATRDPACPDCGAIDRPPPTPKDTAAIEDLQKALTTGLGGSR